MFKHDRKLLIISKGVLGYPVSYGSNGLVAMVSSLADSKGVEISIFTYHIESLPEYIGSVPLSDLQEVPELWG